MVSVGAPRFASRKRSIASMSSTRCVTIDAAFGNEVRYPQRCKMALGMRAG